jgi:hypothetical protein
MSSSNDDESFMEQYRKAMRAYHAAVKSLDDRPRGFESDEALRAAEDARIEFLQLREELKRRKMSEPR